MIRVALVSDAWTPQINGVVRTLTTTVAGLRKRGFEVTTVTPDQFRTIACPGYPEIRLALFPGSRVASLLGEIGPDVVHIATEGPLGLAARRWCVRHRIPFTSAVHTRFPDYLSVRTGLPASWFWPLMKWFHAKSRSVLAATPRLAQELSQRGIANVRTWSRGVDTGAFNPRVASSSSVAALPRPLLLYVGRVAVEKNLPAFLDANVPGTKIVVGDGPELGALREKYWDVRFLGARRGAELAALYAAADVFVFPSRTDTFGLVLIEALASGVPVAAFPVAGPLDIIGADGLGAVHHATSPVGACDDDLSLAIARALTCDRAECARFARNYDWDRCVDQFAAALLAAAGADEAALPLPADFMPRQAA